MEYVITLPDGKGWSSVTILETMAQVVTHDNHVEIISVDSACNVVEYCRMRARHGYTVTEIKGAYLA